jgi:hypothetical protein
MWVNHQSPVVIETHQLLLVPAAEAIGILKFPSGFPWSSSGKVADISSFSPAFHTEADISLCL